MCVVSTMEITPESTATLPIHFGLKTAIGSLILYSREEDIRINFDAWIWPYVDLLEEQKNTQNTDCSPCSVED